MHVEMKKRGILISNGKIPTMINQLSHYIASYYYGVILPTNNIGKRENKWNYNDVEKAISIIKSKAAVVVSK